ncbi:MAG: hypothetical protein AB9903_27680 [Vulcanimicrobiota bacterium]
MTLRSLISLLLVLISISTTTASESDEKALYNQAVTRFNDVSA